MKLVVTVGTTEHEQLIAALFPLLPSLPFSEMYIQIGTSSLPPPYILGHTQLSSTQSLTITRFSTTLDEEIKDANYIISHAGAGSVLSVIRATPQHRTLILVPNTTLLDSHQDDLANVFESNQWALVATQATLSSVLNDSLNAVAPIPSNYPPFDKSKFNSILDTQAGFTPS